MRILLALALVLISLSAFADAPAIGKRTILIQGEIDGRSMFAAASQLAQLSKASAEPITLVINSPGGAIVAGYLFVNRLEAARAKGIRVDCVVADFAASMAFQILMHCDTRHVQNGSFLLWHRVRVILGGFGGAVITAPQAGVLSAALQAADDMIYAELRKNMPEISEKELSYHFENETLHLGSTLAKMAPSAFTSYASIPGLYEFLAANPMPRDNGENKYKPLEIIYRSVHSLLGSN